MVHDDLTAGPRFERFCRHYVVQTKGRWGGRPLVLEGFQRDFWWEALEVDPDTGLRIYSEIGRAEPRKNGKSTEAVAFADYMLVADGENEPEVYIAAAAKDQASIVIRQAISAARRSPRLLDHVIPRVARLECPKNGGIMRAVASLAALQHGFNPSGNVVDELHAHRSSDIYDTLVGGTGAREQPVTFWISSSGEDKGGLLRSMRHTMVDGPGDLEQVDEFHSVYRDRANGVLISWYGAPRDADIEDPRVWLGCNPASWRTEDRLRQEYQRLKARGALMAWRLYFLNQLPDVLEQAWLPNGAWSAAAKERELDPALSIGVGIRKAAQSDHAAVVVAQKQGDGRVVVRHFPFAPEAATGRVSTGAIRDKLRELRLTYPKPMVRDEKTRRPIPGPAYAYDPVQFAESAEMLDQDGLNMVATSHTAAVMAPPTTMAYELVTTGRLIHDGDAVLAEHVGAAKSVITDRGMRIAPPKDPAAPMAHGAIALVMAVAMAMVEPPKAFERKPRMAAGF